MTTEPKILYIAGYSRSGSTLLDMMLGRHPAFAATGELTYLLDDAQTPTRICSCRRPYRACPLYGPWLASPHGLRAEAFNLRRFENRSSLARLIARRVSPSDAVRYRDIQVDLFSSIAQRSGARVVVDSSKSARDAAARPLALARLAGLPVYVLHLTRDPRSVVESYLRNGSNWVAEGHRSSQALETYRPIIGWRLANRVALSLKTYMGEDRYLHLRYEDLVADPTTALDRIGQFVGEDMKTLAFEIDQGVPLTAAHHVGGNRARFSGEPLRLGPTQRASLPLGHAAAVEVANRGLAAQLGY